MSLARRHREFVNAQQAAAAGNAQAAAFAGIAPPMPETGAAAGEYQQLLIALGDDRRQLQEIQSVEAKIERKRALIGRYRPWVNGALSAEVAVQDEIVARMLTWAIDLADWPFALELASHVITHGLNMPEGFKRQPAIYVAEEVAEAALAAADPLDLAVLLQVSVLTDAHDMPDQVRAKLHKAIGLNYAAAFDAFDPEAESAVAGGKSALVDQALIHLNRARRLHEACGVKKQIERMTREMAKITAVLPDPSEQKF